MTDHPPLHHRSVDVRTYDEGGELHVIGELRDEHPWREENPLLHHMELRLRVRIEDMVIVSANATMHAFPHDECPFIEPKFAELEGLSVTRGFTRALRELFAGVSGCQHLHELARIAGPAVFQARAAMRARERVTGGVRDFDEAPMRRNLVGSCHVWAPGGAGEQKLDLGWRPGMTGTPTPSVQRLLGDGERWEG